MYLGKSPIGKYIILNTFKTKRINCQLPQVFFPCWFVFYFIFIYLFLLLFNRCSLFGLELKFHWCVLFFSFCLYMLLKIYIFHFDLKEGTWNKKELHLYSPKKDKRVTKSTWLWVYRSNVKRNNAQSSRYICIKALLFVLLVSFIFMYF